jgi:hypothetical protein
MEGKRKARPRLPIAPHLPPDEVARRYRADREETLGFPEQPSFLPRPACHFCQ